jgi:hypothetical protein
MLYDLHGAWDLTGKWTGPYVGCGSTADKRKKVDYSMKCTSKLIYMRDMNVRVSV